MHAIRIWLLFSAAVWQSGAAAWAAEPIPAADYAALRATILPTADEQRWREIPWGASLWEARRQAAREGKPILLWEMDGHPLGCT